MDEITYDPKAGDTLDDALDQMKWVIGGLGTVWGQQTFSDGRVRIYKLKPGPTQRGWGNQVDAYTAGEAMGLNLFGKFVAADFSQTGKDEYFPPTHEVYYSGRKEDPYWIQEVDTGDPDTVSYSAPYTENDGSLWVYEKGNPNKKIQLSEAPTAGDPPTEEDIKLIKKETLDDGSIVTFYNVGGTIKSYKSSGAKDVIQEDKDVIDVAGGKLHRTSAGQYTFVKDVDSEFTPGDAVNVAGGQLIQTSKNQYQFVRATHVPGVMEHTDTQGNVRQFSQSASGTWTELAARAEPGVVPIGDRDFLRQTSGALAELAPRFDPGIQEVDGMTLLQQRGGQIGQLTPPNLDQIITQALVDGEYDKAFAFQDFRDRPTAQETFQTALQFARSPADQVLISSIARGEQTVQPPPAGTIQRVGPQPDFLVQAYQDFQRRTQAGRAPTEEETQALSERAAAGQSPLTDTLQMRLEEMQEKIRQGEEIHQVKLDGIRREGERKEETWRQLFTQKQETFERDRETFKSVGDIETDDPDTVLSQTGDPARTASIIDEDEDEAWNEQITEENRLAVEASRTQQALDLGYSADAAAKLVGETSSGTPFSQALAMDFQRNLEDMGQANALDLIAKGSGGVESQLSNLAGLSSALERGTTELTQAGSSGSSGLKFRAGGGVVGNREMTVVGEQGPEIAMMPPGTHILPLGKATKQDIRAAQSTGRAYQTGGIVFGDLPIGLRQLQAGRPITPSRGYLSQAAGLTLPSAQAMSNITPESRDVYFDLAQQAGIPSRAFGQELQTATPAGTRLPTSRMLPLGRRGVR
jgi:hypothetical protein